MKKFLTAMSAALLLTSCGSGNDEAKLNVQTAMKDSTQTKEVTFYFGGARAMTRAGLSNLNLTDLWVFDYMSGNFKTSAHQDAGDGFGSLSMSLEYGAHTLYFVASRGTAPTIDTDAKTISWVKPSDTFWASLSLTVSPSMAGSHEVTLRRVATRLRITVTDEVPDGAAKFIVQPSMWYTALDYTTSAGVNGGSDTREISIPSSYIGTSGQLSASFFGLSPTDSWQTDVMVSIKNGSGNVLGSVSLDDVPFSQNVTTQYSGGLFGAGRNLSVDADDAWGDDNVHTW